VCFLLNNHIASFCTLTVSIWSFLLSLSDEMALFYLFATVSLHLLRFESTRCLEGIFPSPRDLEARHQLETSPISETPAPCRYRGILFLGSNADDFITDRQFSAFGIASFIVQTRFVFPSHFLVSLSIDRHCTLNILEWIWLAS
jgi:hypothetical protein